MVCFIERLIRKVSQNKQEYDFLICLATISGLWAINVFLRLPDINDFRGIGAICLLIDTDIRYCVNNNWGFAHPLSCWLLTKFTGDILISQRLLNGVSVIVYTILLIRMVRYVYGGISLRSFICAVAFISSPWMAEAAVSAHMDIIPITLIFAAFSIVIRREGAAAFLAAGITAGVSYWFRFHFLIMALMFPLLSWFAVKEQRNRILWSSATAIGVFSAVSVPHLLSMMAYGVLSLSNWRFVLAEALGLVDWSNEGALRLTNMRISELLGTFNAQRFLVVYCCRLFTSGIFPLMIVTAVVAINEYCCGRVGGIKTFQPNGRGHGEMIILASAAGIAVILLTFLRGFTCRLEAAFVLMTLPMAVGTISVKSRKTAFRAFAMILLGIGMAHIGYWPAFLAHRKEVVAIDRAISRTIPSETLMKTPEKIICCVEYHNPYNKYGLCNMAICGGWGARWRPMIERFGLLDLMKPFENRIYESSEYLILPRKRDVFNYTDQLLVRNEILCSDTNLVILRINRK